MSCESHNQRRQSIIDSFKTAHNLAERIVQLEDECRATVKNHRQCALEHPSCHFAEWRDANGRVTHKRRLGEMDGYELEACEVCGTVQAVSIGDRS